VDKFNGRWYRGMVVVSLAIALFSGICIAGQNSRTEAMDAPPEEAQALESDRPLASVAMTAPVADAESSDQPFEIALAPTPKTGDRSFICTLRAGHNEVAVHFSPRQQPSSRLHLTVRKPMPVIEPEAAEATPTWNPWQTTEAAGALSMSPTAELARPRG